MTKRQARNQAARMAETTGDTHFVVQRSGSASFEVVTPDQFADWTFYQTMRREAVYTLLVEPNARFAR